MPRPVTIPIRRRGTRWQVSIPARYSETGARARPSFATKKKAELHRIKVMAEIRAHGASARNLTPGKAEEMAKAMDLLAEWPEVTLLDAVRDYAERRRKRERSVTFEKLWEEHVAIKTAEGVSDLYLRDMGRTGGELVAKIGRRNVADLEPAAIEKAMDACFATPRRFNNAVRNIRPAFTLAVRRGYTYANPFERIAMKKQPVREIGILTVDEAKAAIAACRDHSKNTEISKSYRVDATPALAAVAIQLFAGVRPAEITRLDWSDVAFDHGTIRISGKHAKTRSARIIPMEDNLVSWLKTIPEAERTGPVCPSGFQRKMQAVRSAAGFSDRQDVLRHTFATYHLAAYADVNRLREAMGHETADVLFNHYRAVVTKQDALKFWLIAPDEKPRKTLIREVTA
ncbi:MAG: tyrosine-type recombinase/integrase [Opitutales bacterium]|nr:tyrosine-type recombinase/integrase [Opitutales bacterium]